MRKTINKLLALLFLLVLGACQEQTEERLKDVDRIISEVREQFIQDGRLELFEVEEIEEVKEGVIIRGVTTVPEAKELLLSQLKLLELEDPIIDQIILLPDSNLGERTWGLVNVSVCNLRTRPGHSQELTSQALMGTPLRILMKEGSWYRVRTPERYIAWVDQAAIYQIDQNELDQWNASSRMMYIRDFGLLRQRPNSDKVISDLSLGAIVRVDQTDGHGTKAYLPDGRSGWLPKDELIHLADLSTTLPEPSSLISLAKTFMGRPYLWGGTSPRGVDCSGFMKTVFYRYGIILSRDANQQVLHGREISLGDDLGHLAPGDLLFFGRAATEERSERVSHVGLYMGNGYYIHSSGRVKINSLIEDDPVYNEYLKSILLHVRRLEGTDSQKGPWSIHQHPWY